jgi:YVTN family beta-propeller protein
MAHNTEGHGSEKGCVECEVPQLARNHYFTGKLLVERDFTDEQRYFMGKDRRHNQRLHGWGTVCGLKVVQHPNPACRSKYVVVRPGYALDCCGREIIVHRDDTFDFRARVEEMLREKLGENDEIDRDAKHRLQICIRYKECAAEDVPALFDECGCDDRGCMPNRVLESYALDVILDAPPKKPHDAKHVELKWSSTVAVNLAQAVALDESAKKLWVGGIASTKEGRVYAYSTTNFSVLTTGSVADPRAFGLLQDGSRLYLGRAKSPFELDVLDTAKYGPAATPMRTITIPGAVTVNIASGADGRVYMQVVLSDATKVSKVLVYDKDLATKLGEVAIGKGGGFMALAPDGKQLFVTNTGDGTVTAIDTTALTASTLITNAGVKYGRIAVTATTADTRLAIVDGTAKKLYLYGVSGATATALGDPYTVAGDVRDLAFSPGGVWIYTLVDEAAHKSTLYAIDAHAIELKKAQTPPSLPIGDSGGELAIAGDGRRIYAAYRGPAAIPNPGEPLPISGGVAVIDVVEHDCSTIIDGIIEGCPACDADECIVLATVNDYTFGSDVTDDRIDNLTDRKLLPSTSVLTDVVRCLLERGGTGTQGPQGLPGPTGPAGKDGEDGKDGLPGKDGKDGEDGKDGLPGKDGQPGKDGKDGKDGEGFPKLDLPHIVAISWPHAGNHFVPGIAVTSELVVAFDRNMMLTTLHEYSFEVYIKTLKSDATLPFHTFLFAKIDGIITGVTVEASCSSTIKVVDTKPKANKVNGVRFQPRGRDGKATNFIGGEYVVLLDGNFILGLDEIEVDGKRRNPALDGEHFAMGLRGPAPNQRCPSGDGIEGGTFRSWFQIGDFT